jgi:hypothetical protein
MKSIDCELKRFIVPLILAIGLCVSNSEAKSRLFFVEGRIIKGYKSFGRLNINLSSPQKDMLQFHDFKCPVVDINKMDSGHPIPLIIKVTNKDKEKAHWFNVPSPSEVIVKTDSSSKSAEALYMPWWGKKNIGSSFHGTISVEVPSDSSVELLYFLPKIRGAIKVSIKGYGRLILKAPLVVGIEESQNLYW